MEITVEDIRGILKQEVNVYWCPWGDGWAFCNGGVMTDGFETKEQAEIAAMQAIIKAALEYDE